VSSTFLVPLGMRSSGWDEASVPSDHLATGYRRDGEAYVKEPRLGDGAGNAMGGLYSSVRDLGRDLAFQLDAWPPRDDADTGPLRRSSRREMHQVHRDDGFSVERYARAEPTRGSSGGYAFGWGASRTCALDLRVGHGGGLPGFGSYQGFLPEYGVAVVALTNLT
jgi:CubicO group peptidase (beta-lactamase class C family)